MDDPRTIARIGDKIQSGIACEACSEPFDRCTAGVLDRGEACCMYCRTTDTHEVRHEGLDVELWAGLGALVSRFGFNAVEAEVGRIKIAMNGPVPQVGERDGDQRTSKGQRSADVRRFSRESLSGRLLAMFGLYSELTDREATDKVVGDVGSGHVTIGHWEGCRRRCSDLREAGYLQDSGHERDDRIVWQITPTGAEALARMHSTGWAR